MDHYDEDALLYVCDVAIKIRDYLKTKYDFKHMMPIVKIGNDGYEWVGEVHPYLPSATNDTGCCIVDRFMLQRKFRSKYPNEIISQMVDKMHMQDKRISKLSKSKMIPLPKTTIKTVPTFYSDLFECKQFANEFLNEIYKQFPASNDSTPSKISLTISDNDIGKEKYFIHGEIFPRCLLIRDSLLIATGGVNFNSGDPRTISQIALRMNEEIKKEHRMFCENNKVYGVDIP
jgi:hypothetical protein